MKLPWSMLKPWGCVESGGLWNLLGFIETKPLIRGGGLGQGIPALTAMKQHTHTHIYIYKYWLKGEGFQGRDLECCWVNICTFQMEVIYILARMRYPISCVQKLVYFSQTPKLTWTYEWTWINISTEHTSYSRARPTNCNIRQSQRTTFNKQ